MITYTSRTLPECSRCSTPMRAAAWVESGGVCSSCATLPEALQRVHNRHALARVQAAAERRAHARIERLARRRAARATSAPLPASRPPP